MRVSRISVLVPPFRIFYFPLFFGDLLLSRKGGVRSQRRRLVEGRQQGGWTDSQTVWSGGGGCELWKLYGAEQWATYKGVRVMENMGTR